MGMNAPRVAVSIALACAAGVAGAAQDSAGVAYCMYCTTGPEFAAAAAGEFVAVSSDRPREMLVVNPGTDEVRRVTLRKSANGRMQVSMTSSISAADAKRLADPDMKADIFVPACNGVTKVSPSGSSAAAAQSADGTRRIERGTLVKLRDGVYGMVLCQSPAFATYSTVDRAALSKALHSAEFRWQVSTFKGAVATYAQVQSGNKTKLESMPEVREVCTIFNNGDSSCFRLRSAHSGSDGRDVGGAESGDVSGGMEIINKGSTIEWGAPGSSGRAGEHWIVCQNADNRISHCVVARK